MAGEFTSDFVFILHDHFLFHFFNQQFKWHLLKKASQVIYLHFALRKRAIIEEIHEKQEQVLSLSLLNIYETFLRLCYFFIP